MLVNALPCKPRFPRRAAAVLVVGWLFGAPALANDPSTLVSASLPSGVDATQSLPAPSQSIGLSELDELMGYLVQARALPPEVLAQELAELKRLSALRQDHATLKLALVWSDQGLIGEGDILALLQPMFDEGRNAKPELRAFAFLLFREVQDRKRMKDSLAAAQTKLKEAQKSQEMNLMKAEQMRRQLDEMQKKFDALKSMEQSILKRGR